MTGKRGPRGRRARGFTLLELIVVIAIIGILSSIAAVRLAQAPRRAQEAVLKQNLFTIRSVIDQYYADKLVYPESLNEMVGAGYLRRMPVDPITKSTDSWQVVYSDEIGDDWDIDTAGTSGIIDVYSGSGELSIKGTPYSEW